MPPATRTNAWLQARVRDSRCTAGDRSRDLTSGAVLHDLDKLRATRDLQIPVDERLDETGARVADMRSVDELMDEADARLAAAAEIRACAMPIPEVTL